MAVLLEEVVLDFPGMIDAEPIGQFDLLQRVLEEFQLGAILPGTRQLMLVEDAKLHRCSPSPPQCLWPTRRPMLHYGCKIVPWGRVLRLSRGGGAPRLPQRHPRRGGTSAPVAWPCGGRRHSAGCSAAA